MKILRYDAGSGPGFGVLGDGGEVRALEGSPFGSAASVRPWPTSTT